MISFLLKPPREAKVSLGETGNRGGNEDDMRMQSIFKQHNTRLAAGLMLLLAGVLLAGITSVRADVIHLDNDRSIEGIIEEETDRHIVIRVGGGRIHFDRSRIVSIERGDPDERDQTLRDWREEQSLKHPNVPADLRALASDFRRLLHARRDLKRISAQRQRLIAMEEELLLASDRLHREAADAHRRLAASDPARDVAAYNRRVAAANELNAALHANHRDLERTRLSMAEQQESMDAYIRHFDDINQRYRAARQNVNNADTDSRRFLDAMQTRLAGLQKDFQEYAIDTEQRGSVSVITARVNDLVDGRFIVDTGAGIVTISAAFAGRLGLPPASPGAPTTRVITADGRHVDARPVIIESLNVAGHTEYNIAAVILEEPPGDSVDGLLGMSFLRRFHVSLEGSGRLILRRLDTH